MLSIAQDYDDIATGAAVSAWASQQRRPSLALVGTDSEAQYRRRLGGAIVQLRGLRGISQATLAEQVGRSEAAVSRWETGKATPTAFDVRRLAEIFELPMDSLDLLLFPPAGPVSPVAERLQSIVAAAAGTGLRGGGRRRADG